MLKVNSFEKKQKLLIFAVLLALIACVIIFSAAPIGEVAHAQLRKVNASNVVLNSSSNGTVLKVTNILIEDFMTTGETSYRGILNMNNGQYSKNYYFTKGTGNQTYGVNIDLVSVLKGRPNGSYSFSFQLFFDSGGDTYYQASNVHIVTKNSPILTLEERVLTITNIVGSCPDEYYIKIYHTASEQDYSDNYFTLLYDSGESELLSGDAQTYTLPMDFEGNVKYFVEFYVDKRGVFDPDPVFKLKDISNIIDVTVSYAVPLPPTPVQEGYTFMGWFYDEDFTEPYENGDIITEDTQLYALMVIKEYTITYRMTGIADFSQSYIAEHFSELQAPDSTLVAENLPEDKYVAGYYLDEACTIKTEIGSEITGDITVWIKLETKTCKVTFYANGAIYKELYIPYGATLVSTEEGAAATAAFSSLSLSPLMMSTFDIDNEITDDIVLYGVLEETTSDITSFFKGNWRYVVGGVVLILIVALVGLLLRRFFGGRRKRR